MSEMSQQRNEPLDNASGSDGPYLAHGIAM
jgi:hypothetical protein